MQITIPAKESKTWTQRNDGDYSGILNNTRNIDLTRKGVARLSERMAYINRYDASSSTFDECLAITFGDFITANSYKYWFITSDKIYTMNTDWTSMAVDSTSGSPSMSIYSDGCAFNGDLYVSTSTQLCKLVSGTWTTSGVITTGYTNTTSPHPVEPLFNNLIATGDKNKIHTVSSTGTIAMNVITLPTNYEILWIRSTADRVFIGTRNLKGLNAKVYEWDGASSTYSFEYEIETTRILSGVIWKGNLYCYTLDGRIMRFNGSGFTPDAQLPFYKYSENVYPEGSPIQITTQRGMITSDDEILIAINPQILKKSSITGERTYYPNSMAGVWAFNPEVGFYHKYGFNIDSTLDFANSYGVKARALFKVPEDITISTTTTTYNSLIASGYITASDGTNYHVAMALKPNTNNRGVIALQKIDSYAADENWKTIGVKFAKLYTSSDKIIVKYKIKERDNLPLTSGIINGNNATWTSATTFTSADSNLSNVLADDEITILDKYGAGSSAHISSISSSAGTYTVTLDEAIGTTSGTFSFIVEPYIKLGIITNDDQSKGYKLFNIPSKNISRSISIKCELRGEDVEIEEIIVSSENNVTL